MVARFVERSSHALNGRIVRFGAAAGEHHFAGSAAQHLGYPLPRIVEGVTRLLPDGVDAGRIAVQLGEIGEHCLQDSRVGRSGAGVVQIYQPGR